MNNIIEAAKKLIMKLNEIQPAVSISGLTEEAATIKEMKGDLVAMIGSITPDHVILGRVLMACREDAVSHAIALRDALDWQHTDPAEMSDDQVLTAIMAAESFIERARDYLGSKAHCYALQGGNHVAA